jgi:topoisomerase IA-like protein
MSQNSKIPKGIDPQKLDLEACMKIVENPDNAPKKRFTRKKTSK